MKFVEIVEITESIEKKLEALSESKLDLLETILNEGAEIEFDVVHHIDYLVEFIEAYSDENATIIAESVNGKEVLNIILESARKNPTDKSQFIAEAVETAGNIEITLVEEEDTETVEVTLLSIVTNTLTEMLGEEAVEAMPAEMVFDIVEAAKTLDISEDAESMDIIELVEEIATKLETAITEGDIDLDTDDYEGETLAEFLNDYSDAEDLLEEMLQVNDEILAEATDTDGARLMAKAAKTVMMVEAKRTRCTTQKCKAEKAAAAKKFFAKNEMSGGGAVPSQDELTGKLKKYVDNAVKASKARKKPYSKDYIQYVLIPGIIQGMRHKGKKMKKKAIKA